jgi:hypothetical protein
MDIWRQILEPGYQLEMNKTAASHWRVLRIADLVRRLRVPLVRVQQESVRLDGGFDCGLVLGTFAVVHACQLTRARPCWSPGMPGRTA